jgi:hypothetical protein
MRMKIEPYVVIEGPTRDEADFCGRWLLAAAKAETFKEEALNDPLFKRTIGAVDWMDPKPHFAVSATVILSQLLVNRASITMGLHHGVDGDDSVFDDFAMMAEMGFFALTGERYRTVIPTNLDVEKVKRALLALEKTADFEEWLHPEHLVHTMWCEEAQGCQDRLRKSDLAGTREWIGSALRSIKPWSPDAIEERQCHE